MTFSPEQIEQLQAKLSVEHVKTRKQAGRTLSYLAGWVAIAEANRIFGHDGWTRETVSCEEACRYEYTIGEGGQNPRDGWKVGYVAKVRVTAGGISREGTGHGNGISTDLYDAIESAAKEAETDAMKRALMTFGNPFGLALYDKDQRNVDRTGGSYGAEADQRMADSVNRVAPKPWGEPEWRDFAKNFKKVIDSMTDPTKLLEYVARNDKLKELEGVSVKMYEALMDYAQGKEEILRTPSSDAARAKLSELDAG